MDPFWRPSEADMRRHFAPGEWDRLPECDKKRYTNLLENYNIMKDLDLNPEVPEFLIKDKKKTVLIISNKEPQIFQEPSAGKNTSDVICRKLASKTSNEVIPSEALGSEDQEPAPVHERILPESGHSENQICEAVVKLNGSNKTKSKESSVKPAKSVTTEIRTEKPVPSSTINCPNVDTEAAKGSSRLPQGSAAPVKTLSHEFTDRRKYVSDEEKNNDNFSERTQYCLCSNKDINCSMFTDNEIIPSAMINYFYRTMFRVFVNQLLETPKERDVVVSTLSPATLDLLGIDINQEEKAEDKTFTSSSVFRNTGPDGLVNVDYGPLRVEPSADNLPAYCNTCGRLWNDLCPFGHQIYSRDLQNPSKETNWYSEVRADELPIGLQLGISPSPQHSLGVFSDSLIEAGVIWGPLKEIPHLQSHSEFYRFEYPRSFITRGHWMESVKFACSEEEANAVGFMHGGMIYYKTAQSIQTNGEIKLSCWMENAALERACIISNKHSHGNPDSHSNEIYDPENNTAELRSIKHILNPYKEEGSIIYMRMNWYRENNYLQKLEKITKTKTSTSGLKCKGTCSIPSDHRIKESSLNIRQACMKEHREYMKGTEFLCGYCTKGFDKRSDMKRHIKEYKCEKGFSQQGSLKDHMKIVTGEKPFLCKQCEKGFSQLGTLKCHMRVHTGEKRFLCKQCEKGFSRLDHLKCHMFLHTGEKPFLCKHCEKGFSTLQHLKCHMRVHTEEKPFLCKQCEKGFSQVSHLNLHMRVHTGEKPFFCKQCEKGFSILGNLKRHMRVHTGEKPFLCNECDKGFSDISDLKRHMGIHTGEKPFLCKQCEKGFSTLQHLKCHMRVHTVEKPFLCKQCEKGFSQVSHLNLHMRVHTGEKPFLCKQCDKGFSHISDLKCHMRIHTGEKPFLCKQCEKGFSTLGNLKRHMMVHAGEK